MASSSLLALPPPSLPPRQVLIKQEIQRKSGYAIQVDEEHLRVQLDTIQSELNAPTQFKVGACVGRVFFLSEVSNNRNGQPKAKAVNVTLSTKCFFLCLHKIMYAVCRTYLNKNTMTILIHVCTVLIYKQGAVK